ncbi:MAG TPA: TatD family hydrolase [Acidimicrobiales bacterium]|nr:TatD family hydrolase [Acidimicrobiales bacterium]
MPWADSHCHVPWEGSDTSAFDAARAAGVARFITIGTGADTSRTAIAAAEANLDVWATVGLHPHDASEGLEGLPDPKDHPRVVAIGECGLDFYYNHSPAEVQKAVFARQIAWAKELDLALVIHTRGAWPETLDILDAEGLPERTIIHCFTGGPEEAKACIERGAFISISGIVTFKKADDVRAAVQVVPLDRILVETDAPFLAPVPHRGKQNEPAFVPLVGAAVGVLRGLDAEEIAAVTWENTSVAFKLPRILHTSA